MTAITIEQYNQIAEESMPIARILGLQLESIDEDEVVMSWPTQLRRIRFHPDKFQELS